MFNNKNHMQLYLEQNSVNDFYISNLQVTSGYDNYVLSLESVVTNEIYTCIPTVLSETDRIIHLEFELDNTAESAPLSGILSIYLPGTFIMTIKKCLESGTITPTNYTQIYEGYAILECDVVETPQTVYNSSTPNPNVFFSPES